MRDLCCELAARETQRFVDDNDLFHEGKLNGAEFRRALTSKGRGLPNGADFRKARSAKRRCNTENADTCVQSMMRRAPSIDAACRPGSELGAVWGLAPFGTRRPLALRALWHL